MLTNTFNSTFDCWQLPSDAEASFTQVLILQGNRPLNIKTSFQYNLHVIMIISADATQQNHAPRKISTNYFT